MPDTTAHRTGPRPTGPRPIGPHRNRNRAASESGDDDVFGLNPEFIADIRAALDDPDRETEVCEQVLALHHADAADLIERLDDEERDRLLVLMKGRFNPEILPELDDAVRDDVLEAIGYADFAALVAELDSDDAVYLIDQLDPQEQTAILSRLPADDRAVIEQGLSYPEYSAGRLMQRELVVVPSYWTVGDAIDYLRTGSAFPEDFTELFVVDPRHRPLGMVRLSALLRARRPVRLSEIMDPDHEPVGVEMDQEEIALLFRKRDLLSAPVVDRSGRLVGRITIDDVVDVIDEEAEDDMLRLAGLSETGTYSAAVDTARTRIVWLMVNLGTALLVSSVIGLFEATLERLVALAVLMPIVASLGGNAGTQTLTAAVRGLATKDLAADNAWRLIGKEVLVGLMNGVVLAIMAGVVTWVWFSDPALAGVISSAMLLNLLVAALFGISIPLVLDRLGVDPAVASSVFLTMMTDMLGFLAFLGLATVFLL